MVEMTYGSSSRVKNKEEKTKRFAAWCMLLKDIPDKVGKAAFERAIRTSHYPPVPADIIEGADALKGSVGEDNIQRYWNLAWRAICGNEEWENLPEAVRRWFGSKRSMVMMGQSEETIESVVRGQFYKSFPEVKEQTELNNSMPETLKTQIKSMLPDKAAPRVSDRCKQLYENELDRIRDDSEREKSTSEEFDARKAKWMSLIRQERSKSRQETTENENTIDSSSEKENSLETKLEGLKDDTSREEEKREAESQKENI